MESEAREATRERREQGEINILYSRTVLIITQCYQYREKCVVV